MTYATGAELKAMVQSNVVTNNTYDDLYDDLVTEASEAIDKHCYRSFAVPTAATARLYRPTADGVEVFGLDDIANTTGLVVAVDRSGDGTYTTLTVDDDYVVETDRDGMVVAIRSTSTFPQWRVRRKSVQVTARYGWPAVPGPVKRACLLWGARLFDRRNNPSGVMGFQEFGGVRISTIDPDVKSLLAPFRDRGKLVGG